MKKYLFVSLVVASFVILPVFASAQAVSYHPADTNNNYKIEKDELVSYVISFLSPTGTLVGVTLSQLARVVTFYNAGGYKVYNGTSDGFAPSPAFHPADTNKNYKIELSELNAYRELYNQKMITLTQVSRAITFYNAGAYKVDPSSSDGFAPRRVVVSESANSAQLASIVTALSSLLNEIKQLAK